MSDGQNWKRRAWRASLAATCASVRAVLFGDDMPKHVFPADTADQIVEALVRLEHLDKTERQELAIAAQHWFARQLSPAVGIGRLVDILQQLMRESPRCASPGVAM